MGYQAGGRGDYGRPAAPAPAAVGVAAVPVLGVRCSVAQLDGVAPFYPFLLGREGEGRECLLGRWGYPRVCRRREVRVGVEHALPLPHAPLDLVASTRFAVARRTAVPPAALAIADVTAAAATAALSALPAPVLAPFDVVPLLLLSSSLDSILSPPLVALEWRGGIAGGTSANATIVCLRRHRWRDAIRVKIGVVLTTSHTIGRTAVHGRRVGREGCRC